MLKMIYLRIEGWLIILLCVYKMSYCIVIDSYDLGIYFDKILLKEKLSFKYYILVFNSFIYEYID